MQVTHALTHQYLHWADVAAVRCDAHGLKLLPSIILDDLGVVELRIRNHANEERPLVLKAM